MRARDSGSKRGERDTGRDRAVPPTAVQITGARSSQLLHLQRRIGNRATSRLTAEGTHLFPQMIQAQGTTVPMVQPARYPESQTGRVQKPTFLKAVGPLDYFAKPSYIASPVRGAGGAHSTAVLGPAGSYLNVKSDAVSSLPHAIGDARLAYPQASFKAGHLLNAAFGGDGTDADNLTILSAKGNANHKAFDEPAKRAVASLQKAYYVLWNAGIDISQETIGIAVSVAVTGSPWGTDYPDSCIFDGLTCKAEVVGTVSEELDEDVAEAFEKEMKAVIDYCEEATASGAIANT